MPRAQKVAGLVGQPIGQVLARAARLDRGYTIRIEVRRRASQTAAADVDIKALMLWPERAAVTRTIAGVIARQVSLAKKTGRIADLLEPLGNSDLCQRQHVLGGRWLHAALLWPKRRAVLTMLRDV